MEEFNNKFEDFILARYSTIYTKIEEKEEYKKTMIPYLGGALLIFGASAIAKAVIAISENLTAG